MRSSGTANLLRTGGANEDGADRADAGGGADPGGRPRHLPGRDRRPPAGRSPTPSDWSPSGCVRSRSRPNRSGPSPPTSMPRWSRSPGRSRRSPAARPARAKRRRPRARAAAGRRRRPDRVRAAARSRTAPFPVRGGPGRRISSVRAPACSRARLIGLRPQRRIGEVIEARGRFGGGREVRWGAPGRCATARPCAADRERTDRGAGRLEFRIDESSGETGSALVPADVATCEDCLQSCSIPPTAVTAIRSSTAPNAVPGSRSWNRSLRPTEHDDGGL